jgi:predicted aspartyl protease
MRSLRVVNLLWCLHVFAAAVPLVARSDVDADVIAFDVDGQGAVVVPVRVDGAGPFMFLLDTGSTHSAIGDTLAASLGIRAVAKAEIMSAAGHVLRPVARLGRMTVGGAARDGILASVLPSADLDAFGGGIDGVIGQDFLSVFDFTLDYRHGRLTWEAAPAPDKPGDRLALTWDAGRFVVELPQGSGRSIRLVPDTGSASLVIFDRPGTQAAQLPMRNMRAQARMSSIAGTRTVSRAVVQALRIGDVVLRDEPAVVVDGAGSGGTQVDGLLPLHRFARVSFSAGERCLVVAGW